MVKNIIIGLLVAVSLGSVIFAFYQRTLAEQAKLEVLSQTEIALEAQEMARSNAEEAMKQQEMARLALIEAEKQRQIALSKCK